MAEEKNEQISLPRKYDLDAKWDACLDLGLRRVVYSSLAGTFGGLLLFRSPVTRWASVALGAGVGIGSAYMECSYIFDGSTVKPIPPNIPETPVSKVNDKASRYNTKGFQVCSTGQNNDISVTSHH